MDDALQTPVAHPADALLRRRLLSATGVAGVAAGLAAASPFVASLAPSARARSAGAPVAVDLDRLAPGELLTVEWRGKPVWILHRTPAMLASLAALAPRLADPESARPMQPAYAGGTVRARRPEFLVVIGLCTHLGCSPSAKLEAGAAAGLGADWPGGFLCPCHGSTFDLAGRVFRNKPAPDNLEVPPHHYLSDTRLVIGSETKEV